ncbi:MAG: UvrD-helicase domain-containing protein [Bacteroidaceae bacterium]|nr:UvrD-helicase domain-containing protein [Bacteroidaceae bacterium]
MVQLDTLNAQQLAAVEYIDGASLVIAGAGSGKTRVLTYKIAYLVDCGLEPWRILALTFTNKAANEMKERIGQLIGPDRARYLHMGTFHSIFARILRREAQSMGYTSAYTIYDETDSRQLIKQIVKELQLDDKDYKPATLHAHISMAKNFLVLPDAYAKHAAYRQRDKNAKLPRTAEIYQIYQQRLRQSNAMDFDDLLVNTYLLFEQQPDIRQHYAQQYGFVLVDEYQDTNYVQQCILLQLTREHQHVCVVGDDAQSIYAFRGANIDNILDFQQQYNNVQLFKLERNYRSTERIVGAANSLIQHNERQIQKEVFSQEGEGSLLMLQACIDDKQEATYVATTIAQQHRRDHTPYNDMAVLYRTHAQSRVIEEHLRKMQIPYRIYGGMSFYQRKEVKDIMAYLRLLTNPSDDEALRRIVNYPARGIGATTLGKLSDAARSRNLPIWDMLSDQWLLSLPVNSGTRNKLLQFRNMMTTFALAAREQNAYQLTLSVVKESGIADDLKADLSVEGLVRVDNMQELLASVHDFVETSKQLSPDLLPTVDLYLQDAALRTDADEPQAADEDAVTLMTVHSAKGLEYDTVFVVGLEENVFPSQRSMQSLRELEEERRLLYVAITRAKHTCCLSYAESRFRYGATEFNRPSRFLRDIDKSFLRTSPTAPPLPSGHRIRIQQPERKGRRLIPWVRSQRNTSPDTINSSTATANTTANSCYPPGCRVRHSRFGEGTVVECQGSGDNLMVKVNFDKVGEKQLLAKFAKLVILS